MYKKTFQVHRAITLSIEDVIYVEAETKREARKVAREVSADAWAEMRKNAKVQILSTFRFVGFWATTGRSGRRRGGNTSRRTGRGGGW